MKTKWFVMAMLTVLMGLSVSVVQAGAMTLDLSNGTQLDDDGGGGTVPEPAELYPVAMTDDGDGTGDTVPEPAE